MTRMSKDENSRAEKKQKGSVKQVSRTSNDCQRGNEAGMKTTASEGDNPEQEGKQAIPGAV